VRFSRDALLYVEDGQQISRDGKTIRDILRNCIQRAPARDIEAQGRNRMRQIMLIIAAATAATFALHAAPALAQSNRTFVSGHGAYSGTCPLTTPCRSFQYAHNQTNSGGEITILDPAGYGSVTINKAISIVNDGIGEAGVTVTSAVDAITVSAPNTASVNLRGLTLVGGLVGVNGITVTNVGALNIQNCVIGGFTNRGISFTAGGPATFTLSVLNTLINGNSGTGIFLSTSGSGATINAIFERVQSIANSSGIVVFGGGTNTIRATADESVAANNISLGFSVGSSGSGTTTFSVVNSKSANNQTGLSATSAGGRMFLSGSIVSGNSFNGFNASGGIITTYGNNTITDATNTGSLTAANPLLQ
jgi:hypothetical protein